MIDITQYLQVIFEDFKKYIEMDVCLCKFKNLNFEAGALPNYNDINIQQLYLLRYAFAYAFEYSRMYLEVLSQLDDVSQVSVTSVGCGSMIDYWALIHALEIKGLTGSSIRYVGIDEIDWNYKFPKRENDEVYYLVENAKDYFVNSNEFVSDVFFFPKSISEFSESELGSMANSLLAKKTSKNKFFICISLREDQGSMDRDIQKTKCIISAIEQNGFITKWPYSQYTYFNSNDGIVLWDSAFKYPQDALQFVTNLNMECAKYKINEMNCHSDCQKYLDRWPILRIGHIRYQVIMFERWTK